MKRRNEVVAVQDKVEVDEGKERLGKKGVTETKETKTKETK